LGELSKKKAVGGSDDGDGSQLVIVLAGPGGFQANMNDAYACEQCFADSRLVAWIRENGKRGRCDWCGASRCYRVPLADLGEIFRKATKIYEEVDYPPGAGDFIWDLVQDEWGVFSEDLPQPRLKQLARSILQAGIDPKELVDFPELRFSAPPQTPLARGRLARAHSPALQSSPGTRFSAASARIGATPDPPEALVVVFEDLSESLSVERPLFRARIHKSRVRKRRFTVEELGAPPPDKARAGRANAEGAPVLYAATDPETAVAEVRAWSRAAVAIANINLLRDARVVTCARAPNREPFFEEYLEWKLQLRPLFERFADDLSRPVMPSDAAFQYLPSQHLCQLIQEAGYDGVVYPSSLGPGANVVLFAPVPRDGHRSSLREGDRGFAIARRDRRPRRAL